MKCPLGLKKRRRIEAQTGRKVLAAYVRGGWTHGMAEVWFEDRPGSEMVQYAPSKAATRERLRALGREGALAMAEMLGVTVCDKCLKPLRIGEYPFCPHGHGSNGIEDATWPGGITFENLGHEPVTLYSPAELKREMAARNLEPMIRHLPGDPHTRSWATMDAYTLEQGRILAERQATSRVSHREPGPNPATVAEVKRAWAEAEAR